MTRPHSLGLLSLLVASILSADHGPQSSMTEAETIYRGAAVLSFETDPPRRAEAIALADGEILAVGSEEEILARRGSSTRMIDLPEGSAVLPGLIDAHAHLLGLGLQLSQLDLVDTAGEDEIVARVAAWAEAHPDAPWIVGRGWDQNDWERPALPSHEALSRAVPHRPVFLVRIDGHAAWVNAEAMRRAGIETSTPDPEGGRIHRDPETGRATGILVDAATGMVRRLIEEPGLEERKRLLLAAQEACHRVGLTGVHDAGVGEETLAAYRSLAAEDRLRLRSYVMLGAGETVDLDDWFERGPIEEAWLSVRSVKVYLDGALGSRGAALLRPYRDEPSNMGLFLMEPAELLDLSLRAFRAGWQVNAHAIGDRANRLALDTFQDALRRSGVPSEQVRPRIEHAQILDSVDIPRFGELGVTASMQPTHCTSDMDWADERLGAQRLEGAYAWKSLLDHGAPLAFGSDFPVERPHPLEGVYAAVTRRHRRPPHGPPGGFHPREALTTTEALRAFTIGAARAAFAEERLGRIAPGMEADLVVLDRDPTRIAAPEELLEARVLRTVVAGETVFSAER